MRSLLPRPPPGGGGDGQHGGQHLPRPDRVSGRRGRDPNCGRCGRHRRRGPRRHARRGRQDYPPAATDDTPPPEYVLNSARPGAMLEPQLRYVYVLLSGSVIVLAYVAAAAVIVPAVSMIGFGRIPRFLRRGAEVSKTRTRMEGIGLLLIGAFILTDALAADLGRRSEVPQDWILLVWVLLAAGLIGIRYIAGRAEVARRPARTAAAAVWARRPRRKPQEPAA